MARVNYFQDNLAAIKTSCPSLYEKLRNSRPSKDVEIVISKSGLVTLRKQGKLWHSLYDPRKEAQKILSAAFKAKDNIFILGFGMGYHVEELLRSAKSFNHLFIIEPDLQIFRAALESRYLVPLFKHKRLLFFVDVDPIELAKCLIDTTVSLLSSQISIIELPSAAVFQRDYFSQTKKVISDAVRTSVVSLNTLCEAGDIFLANALRNIPEIIKAQAAKDLFGKFENVPAVIVSAGPSLDKNIDLLQQAKGKCLILSTDTAFKILLAHKIKPDFILTLDFQEKSRLHFEGVPVSDVPIIFDPEASFATLEAYKGERFVALSVKPVVAWISTFVGNKGVVAKGMSVAHFAFSMAKAMGCGPIILIGQDLSYPGGFTHARGTTSREQVSVDAGKKNYLKVKSTISQEELVTDNPMYIYMRYFERLVKESGRLCINATEGGAGIKGTVAMKLEDAIKQYCVSCTDIEGILNKVRTAKQIPDTKDAVLKIKAMLADLKKIESASKKMVDIFKQIFEMADQALADQKKLVKLLVALKRPAAVVKQAEVVLDIIHADIFKEVMHLKKEDDAVVAKIMEKGFKGTQDMAEVFKADFNFQIKVYRGVRFFKERLKMALEDVEKPKSRDLRS